MAGFQKRRRKPGPSKNEEKVSRGKEEERMAHPSNRLGNRYGSAERLALALTLTGNHQEVLGQETRSFGREDACSFGVDCPGLCGGGRFDLSPKISEIVSLREPSVEFSLICQERTYGGAGTSCGVTLKCRVDASYKPIPA
jgi:hypothetical protein